MIESLVARTAAERHTREDAAAIRAALERYEQASNAAGSRSTDVDLHRSIATATATHNPMLTDLSRQLPAQVSLGNSHEPFTPGMRETALPQHRALVEAILAGDADAAEIARDHFRITEHALRSAVDKASSTET